MKLRLDQLEPNRWNANEVTGDKYLLLVKDMGEAGQREPVTVSPKYLFYGLAEDYGAARKLGLTDVYVICDGEHRYKAAVELGWAELEATVENLTEDQAVTRFYRQQATRGGFDPLKEALMFRHYLDEGLSQPQVVEKLGLSSVGYLNDRLALLNLSPLVQGIVENLKGMLADRIKERATNESKEELQELIEETFERSKVDTIKLRYISTLPHNDQALLISALLDTFADGGTVSTRQVAQMVKDVKARNDALVSFNEAWKAAATKNCPLCGRPPTLGGWDQSHRDAHTFACAGGHSWRYDVTPEQAHVQEAEGRRQRAEEAQRRAEEAVATRKTRDAETLTRILLEYKEPPQLQDLMREFYQRSDIIDFGDVRKAVALYLQDHPDVRLTEPPTPEQLETKKQQEEQDRREYLEEKLAHDEHHLKRIATLYRDELTRRRLLADYLELSRTVNPQDGRDVIALYLERHPEVTFPGDEPDATDRAISEALGQPPVPKERGDISKVLFDQEAEEWEDQETDEDLEDEESDEEGPEEPLSLLMPLTAAELHSRLVPWILGKVDELSDVKSIRIEGLRDREEVALEYAEPDAKGRTKFSFRVQTTTPVNEHTSHIDSWSWTSFDTRQTAKGLEVTSGKLSSAEEKDLNEIARFIDKIVYRDLDPWDDPDALTGPTGFTLTPVDAKGEPTPPVPDHGRGYQENQDAGEEHHEHYDRDEDAEAMPTCPECGKVSPNAHYCTSCGALFEEAPKEDVAHALTDLEQEWSATATGKLGGLANRLSLEEALWLRDRETRRRALKHLDRRIAEIRLASAPTITLEEE